MSEPADTGLPSAAVTARRPARTSEAGEGFPESLSGQPSDIEQLCRADFDYLYKCFFALQCSRTARAIEAAYAFWRQQLGQEAAYAIKVAAVRAHNDGMMSGKRSL